jgi:hypothetical protein
VKAPIISCPANLFHWLIVSCFALVIGSSMSCETHPNLIIYQSEALSIVLRELPDEYPSLLPHNHPYTIPPKKALEVLGALEYGEGSLLPFSQGRAHRVFSRRQAESLAPELSKALSLALPQEVAAFTLADEEKPDRRTKGLGFILGDELHLIIEELRRPYYQGEQKPYQQQLFRWELLPGSRQRHYTSRPEGKGMITNWIITPLR